MPRRGEGRGRPAARPGDRVQVNVVRHLVVLVVVQVELDLVALANADESAGHMPAKGPEHIIHAVRQLPGDFLDFEVDHHFRCVLAGDRRRHVRRVRQHRRFHPGNAGSGGSYIVRRRLDFGFGGARAGYGNEGAAPAGRSRSPGGMSSHAISEHS